MCPGPLTPRGRFHFALGRAEYIAVHVLQVLWERVDQPKGLADVVILVHEQIEFQLLGRCLPLSFVEALRREHDELYASLPKLVIHFVKSPYLRCAKRHQLPRVKLTTSGPCLIK